MSKLVDRLLSEGVIQYVGDERGEPLGTLIAWAEKWDAPKVVIQRLHAAAASPVTAGGFGMKTRTCVSIDNMNTPPDARDYRAVEDAIDALRGK